MERLLSIMRKEFLQLRRNPLLLRMLIVAPVVQLIMFGYAVTLDIREIHTALCDLDRSAQSRSFIRHLEASGYFRIRYRVENPKELDGLLDSRRVAIALLIGPKFSESLFQRRSAPVAVLVDGTNSNSATIALGYMAGFVRQETEDQLRQWILRQGGSPQNLGIVDAQIRIWYNPQLKSQVFMVPGVIGLILMIMTLIMTAMAVVRERELGTLEQLLTTPIRPWQLLAGKTLPFIFIGYLDVALVIAVAQLWFRIPLVGSLGLLFLLTGCFILCTLGIGIFVSTISRTQHQAMMTAFFFIFPNMVLSGLIYPIENMPHSIQALTYLMPMRYFLTIVRGIFLKGVGLEVLWPQAVALLLLGGFIFTVSVLRFQKRLT